MSGYGPYMQGSSAMGLPALQPQNMSGQKDTIFPERPGQPECQYYMKTGDCKFGITCRYHHPKDRATPSPTCVLSPIGLPLRPVSTLLLSAFCSPRLRLHILRNWLSRLCGFESLLLCLFGCHSFLSTAFMTCLFNFCDHCRGHLLAPFTPAMVYANLDPPASLITP